MILQLTFVITAVIQLSKSLPLVDPGLFVISGVQTCGNGMGYCLLGTDCRLNQDFEADSSGHCSGLKGAFTPSAHFVCCSSPQHHNELHQLHTKPTSKPVPPVLSMNTRPPVQPSLAAPSPPPVSVPLLPMFPSAGGQEGLYQPPPRTNISDHLMSPSSESQQTVSNPPQQPDNSGVLNTSISNSQELEVKVPQVLSTTLSTEDETPTTTIGTTLEAEGATVATGHQTITSPPDYVQVDSETTEDEAENSVDWEGGKNLTEVVVDYCPPCNSQAVFSEEGGLPLCLGTHLRHGWVLTSGSCALKIFRSGMIKVFGKYLQDPEVLTQVKTIAVHEDYRPYSSNILHPEPNNIGLVLLSSEPKKSCSPCIPDKEDKFAGKLCSTTSNSTALSILINRQEKVINDNVCEAIVETMQGEGTEDFYTVACDSNSDSRYSGEEDAESGKGLLCRGYIAGIETGSGTGLSVFTRVSQHSDWITTNMMQQQRQDFDTAPTTF